MRSRNLLLLCLVFFLIVKTDAQQLTGCGFKVPPRALLRNNFQSVYEAKEIVENMLDSINWKENFNLKESNGIRNAYATIINKVRWIIYDNNFLEDIDAYTATKWSSISVLAHEMGHHYYNHVISSQGSTPPREIEADAFSGYVMQRLGATLQQSIAAMQAIASDRASSTHPAKKDRVAAITRGWNTAKNSTSGTIPGNPNNQDQTPANNDNPTSADPSKDPSWIWLTMQSSQDETVLLSDDGKNFQPATIKTGQPLIFKFEIYKYGWLKLKYFNGYRVYKLLHGKDYSILWSRRSNNWTVVEVPQ